MEFVKAPWSKPWLFVSSSKPHPCSQRYMSLLDFIGLEEPHSGSSTRALALLRVLHNLRHRKRVPRWCSSWPPGIWSRWENQVPYCAAACQALGLCGGGTRRGPDQDPHGEAERVEVRMPSPAHDSAASLDHLCSLALDQVGNCFAVHDSVPTVARLLCVSKKIHEGLLRTGWYAYCNRCKAYRRRRVQERRADHAWMQGARGASRSRAGW